MMDWRLWKSAIGYWSSPKHQGHGGSVVFFHICSYVCSELVNQLLDVGRIVAKTGHRRSGCLGSVLTYLLIKTREARPAPPALAPEIVKTAPPHSSYWSIKLYGGGRGRFDMPGK